MLFHLVTIIGPNFDFQKRVGIDPRSGHPCDNSNKNSNARLFRMTSESYLDALHFQDCDSNEKLIAKLPCNVEYNEIAQGCALGIEITKKGSRSLLTGFLINKLHIVNMHSFIL